MTSSARAPIRVRIYPRSELQSLGEIEAIGEIEGLEEEEEEPPEIEVSRGPSEDADSIQLTPFETGDFQAGDFEASDFDQGSADTDATSARAGLLRWRIRGRGRRWGRASW